MTIEQYEAKLTAYALDDPSITAEDRQSLDAALARDPSAKAFVDETRRVAAMLTTGLAAELETPVRSAGDAIVTPASLALRAGEEKKTARRGWTIIAASFLIAAGATAFVVGSQRQTREFSQAKYDAWKSASEQQTTAALDSNKTTGFGGGIGGIGGGGIGGIGGGGMNGGIDGKLADGRGWQPVPNVEGAIPSNPVAATSPMGGELMGGQAGQMGGMVPNGRPAKPGEGALGSPDGATAKHQSVDDSRFGRSKNEPGMGYVPPGMLGRAGHVGQQPAPGSGEGRQYSGGTPDPNPYSGGTVDLHGTNRFTAEIENKFIAVEGQNALSTFGVDVDTASYSIVRKFLTHGQMPPAAAVRLEELVNYFPYRDAAPEGDDPYKVTVELAECPWQPKHKLARIGLKAKPIDNEKRPLSNLVFLVDVSGSMASENKLPWVKQSLTMLVDQLRENDRVAIVVYAGNSGVVLNSTNATRKAEILSAISGLQAGGSTNGGSGIQLAYDMAVNNFIEGGTNRVILCTDGDWNVGTTGTEALVELIEAKRKTGVFLSVLGFGMGNLRDEMMVKLAGKGNGNYAYIDDLKEARKVLVEQIAGTLVTVAKDVKIQIEFNPARVALYRLLGYEKRALAAKDFADDKKDAGEMGAGHVVTALYELVPTAVAAMPTKAEEPLKYQPMQEAAVKPEVKGAVGEAFTLKLRHKLPTSDKSTLRELPVTDVTKPYSEASEDFRFSAAVASFAMLLRESPYKGNATYGLVAELANAAKSFDPNEYRAEFIKLVQQAKQLSGKP